MEARNVRELKRKKNIKSKERKEKDNERRSNKLTSKQTSNHKLKYKK